MQRGRYVLLLAILVAFTIPVSYSIAERAPFEVDESVYAAQARAWATGGPVTGILPHRAPLLPVIGTGLYKTGARSEYPFRVVGLLFGLAAIVMVWALARAMLGNAPAAVAAAAFAGAPSVQLRSSQFLTDIPATVLLLAATLVIWRNRAHAGCSLLWLAPLSAGAIYFRYASVVPVALVVIVALALWHRELLANRALVIGTAVLFAGLLVPHLVRAVQVTGKPWGLITFTAGYAGRRYLGQGVGRYALSLPVALAGPVAGVIMLAGIFGALFRRSKDNVFLVATGVLDIVLLGIVDHAEARFVFFPIALLCVAGSGFAVALVRDRRVQAVVLAGAVVWAGVFAAARTHTAIASRAAPRAVGRIIAARATRPCIVLSVDVGPTTWYSGCGTYYFNVPRPRPADFMVIYHSTNWFFLSQPKVLPGPHGPPIDVVVGGRSVATIYTLSGPVQ